MPEPLHPRSAGQRALLTSTPRGSVVPLTSDEPERTFGWLHSAGGALLFIAAVVVASQLVRSPGSLLPTAPFAERGALEATAGRDVAAAPTADAFGKSGGVKVRLALPAEPVEFPLAVAGASDSLRYQWVSAVDSTTPEPPLPLTAAATIAPHKPGFYHLAVLRGSTREVLSEPTLAVMMPFDQKVAGTLHGYRIGTYVNERLGQRGHQPPRGFVEVPPGLLDLPLSTHLKLADFVTHDDQGDVWPKYVALDAKLLDKLELVFADLGGGVRPRFAVDVHSGFRSPLHNARVARAARDSRHQYGDAADIAVDVDGDGRVTITDVLLVMLSVERVEEKHPELVGGLGLYTSHRYREPYVHIDARGTRTRWRG